MKNQIKCIIFDFGRVIGNFDHMITCRKLAAFSKLSAKEIYEKIFKSGLEKKYDEGQMRFFDFAEKVRIAIGANSEDFNAVVFNPIWGDIFSENPGIQKLLETVKPDVKKLILSNTNEVHWHYISKMPAVKNFFSEDELILSYRLGFRKPDERIFLEGIKKSSSPKGQIIYIDDVLEYTQVFQKLGGNAILYNCQTDPIEKLQTELSWFGVLK